ncbi:MAG TPA: HEAT repeat domain-containing protein [Sedimentisphaerales bacterium]|nr:HEAT repeat domain-containing protein [Sedimentisphaerales bacterium]
MDKKLHAIKAMLAVLAGCWFAAGCTLASEQTMPASQETSSQDKKVYLFSSFRGEKEGLYLAYSDDLYYWTEIPGPHMKPTIGDMVMRDPFIMMGPDGTIHMVWTTGWRRRDIGYANTRDLINWTEPRLIPLMRSRPGTKNCWAPKIFYDGQNKQWQIVWSSWVDDGTFPPPDLPHTSKQHRVWYVTTKDFETFTEPKVLLDPGYSCIDAYLIQGDHAWLLFFKDERYNDSDVVTPAHQNIRIARSKTRYGPFGDISEPITGQGPGKWHNEGPCVVKHKGEYYVFYDHHSGDTYYGATKSKDLKHWTDVSDKMNFPKGLKHGSIIKVRKRIVDALLAPPSLASSDPNAHYSELLKEAVDKAGEYHGVHKLMTSHMRRGRDCYVPRFDPLVEGLDDVDAVPFLLEVIYQGPPWEPSSRLRDRLDAYVARSYALLSLAASGDRRAFGVLSDLLQNADDIADPNLPEVLKQKYDMRAYAAAAFGTLGDPNAVDLLLGTLDDPNPYVKEQTFWALAKIGEPRAIRPMLEQALADDEIRDRDFDSCMVIITKMDPEADYSRERREITYKEFPELGPFKGEHKYGRFWQHWLTVGERRAREHFEDKYGKWKIEKKAHPHLKGIDDRDKKKMLKHGVATLPFMIEQVRQGETDLIPLISELVGGKIPVNATPQQCLEWWDNNKHKWTIPFDEPSPPEAVKGASAPSKMNTGN